MTKFSFLIYKVECCSAPIGPAIFATRVLLMERVKHVGAELIQSIKNGKRDIRDYKRERAFVGEEGDRVA